MYAADVLHDRPALAEKLAHLYTLRGGPSVDLTIRPSYYELLRRLGNPHTKLPPVIHIAGTNGKGSTAAFLHAIFEAAGHQVHVYTSPHLLRFNERIVLAGQEISDDALEALLDEVVGVNEGLPLTFFEITTALAFLAFSRTPADILILETGLGGRLDCTNVVENPLATVITPIGYDHMEFLGDTIPKIAREKAGIMKRFTPCIIAPQDDPAADSVFSAQALKTGVVLYRGGIDWTVKRDTSSLNLSTGSGELILPLPSLWGPHQTVNSGVAAMTAVVLKDRFAITGAHIETGLKTAKWPGRMQRIVSHDLMNKLPPGSALWFDGAHNLHAAHMLAAQAGAWREADNMKLCLIMGMFRKRDPVAFLDPLRGHADRIITVPIPDEPDAHPFDSLSESLSANGWDAIGAPSLGAAFDLLRAATDMPVRVLVCGSLYLYKPLMEFVRER